jgi:hypothetical protein
MALNRECLSPTPDKIMKFALALTLATLVSAGAASAAPAWHARTGAHLHAARPAPALHGPETTGSIGRLRVPRDRQGRDFRSSTRGNAQFPARLPVQQNLGGTAGGPEF